MPLPIPTTLTASRRRLRRERIYLFAPCLRHRECLPIWLIQPCRSGRNDRLCPAFARNAKRTWSSLHSRRQRCKLAYPDCHLWQIFRYRHPVVACKYFLGPIGDYRLTPEPVSDDGEITPLKEKKLEKPTVRSFHWRAPGCDARAACS